MFSRISSSRICMSGVSSKNTVTHCLGTVVMAVGLVWRARRYSDKPLSGSNSRSVRSTRSQEKTHEKLDREISFAAVIGTKARTAS